MKKAILLLLGTTAAVQVSKVSDESRKIINSAVTDVLSITGAGDAPTVHHHHVHHSAPTEVHHHHTHTVPVAYPVHHEVPVPVAVPGPEKIVNRYINVPGPVRTETKEVPVPYAVPVPMPTPQPVNPPHSSVMRAIADANQQSAADTVDEQRTVADKLEKIEAQARINEAINESVKKEEQRVIDDANKRMAEVHAKKAKEAAAAAEKIEALRKESKTKQDAAKKEEADAIAKVISTHSSNVVQ